MNRWLALLLLAIPAALIARSLNASPLLIFVLAALGIVPLAGLIGQSTKYWLSTSDRALVAY